ncbi:MAG: sulfotransferase family 2 domain-containing protein, partial [Oryzihumus sp.]
AFHVSPRKNPELSPLYRCRPQHVHASMLRHTLRLGRFDSVFSVTREPLARFRSEYAMRKNDPAAGSAERVEQWARWCLERYAKNTYILDNHIRPQYDFLLPGATTYRLEDGMESIVADLERRFDLGLAGEVPQHLSSRRAGRLSSSDVEINSDTEKLLRDFYADDFEHLGY